MSDAYNSGKLNSQNTTYAPTTDTLKARGLSDGQVSDFLKGYSDGKR